MARIRTIKPEFASDEKLARVSRDARLTFVLCITQADDDGLLPGNDRQLLAALYPMDDDVTYASLAGMIEELVDLGRLRWRETRDGSPVLEIVNWAAHQKVDHKGKSVLLPTLKPIGEESPRESRVPREGVASASRSDLGPTTVDRGPQTAPRKAAVRVVPADDPTFSAAFAKYPRRAGNNSSREAHVAWLASVRRGADPAEMDAGTERYAAFARATGIEGTGYVMQGKRFYGPSEQWREAWSLPVGSPKPPDAAPRILRATEMLL